MYRTPRALLLGTMIGFVGLTGAPHAQAQLEKATVQVEGLACPFCVTGIEKHVKKVEGVSDVTTSLKRGELALSFKPHSVFDLPSINRAIVRGGFTPGPATVTATGSIQEEDGRFVLKVSGSPASFRLFEDDALEANESNRDARSNTLTQATEAALTKAVEENQLLRIMGRVHTHKDGSPGLSIQTISVADANEGDE